MSQPSAARSVIVFRNELLPVSETFILSQAQSLRSWRPTLLGDRRVVGGLSLDGIPNYVANPTNAMPRRLERYFRRACNTAYPPMGALLSALKPDLLHVHFGTDAVDLWPTASELDKPVVVTLHGYDVNIQPAWWESGHGGLIRRSYPRRLLDLARRENVAFIAVSDAIRNRAIALGIPETKVATRYIGINCKSFQPGPPVSERPRRVLFVGRLVEKKGVKFLIKAFASIASQVPDAILTVAGEGPMRAELERFARDLGVAVDFPGAISSQQVREYLWRSRAFCLPSLTAGNGDAEGFGLALLEAQACGVPVVTSALGGRDEGLISNQTGFSVPERSDGLIAERLLLLLQDDEMTANMAMRAARFVRNKFDIETCTRSLETLYDSIYDAHLRTSCATAA